MKDEILKRKVERLTTYTDGVSNNSWCELIDELVNEINTLEAELEESYKDYDSSNL